MRPLAEYNRKRNFRVTPEPGAKVKASPKKGKLIFVVQEHHASHLHYDFRLEWEGVLKSWAVPKGPSLDPKDRRLAVEVEDHPKDYATFTGAIPAGEYGAGDVYRWDMGTWVPGNDPNEGLRKGRLEFTLKGKKLKGDWLLVRTRARESSKPQWLLIKRHDDYAVEGAALEMAAPLKKTARKGGSARAKKSPSKRGGAKAKKPSKDDGDAPVPDFISPQLCQLVTKPPVGPDWVHEIKFDGYRIQVHVENGKCRLFTRRGHDWTDKYRGLEKVFKKLNVENAVIDGEVVWQDEKGRSSFQGLQNAMKKGTDALVYWAFDLLFLNGENLMSLPLAARKDRLEKLIKGLKSPLVRYSDHFRESGEKLLKASCEMQLEGIISKRIDRPYSPGRRDDWVKAKCTQRQEFVIGGFSDAEGTRIGFGSLLLGVYDGKDLRYVGRVGTGFDQQLLLDIGKKLRKLEIKTSPFASGSPRGARYHWVQPKMVAEVSFSEWTADQHLRVPVFQGLRADKAPEQIGIEKAKKVIGEKVAEEEDMKSAASTKGKTRKNAASTKHAASSKKKSAKSSGDPVVSHPDRVVYKKERLTKQDVANYYQKVSEWMLPHIEDRPLSLLRCTQNSTTGCFFSKHFAERLPENLIAVPEKGKQPWVAVDSPEGLASLVQYGSLEIHPWNCHRQKIEYPDQIVIDFDPDPTVGFAAVKEGAFELRELLKQLGLRSFVKVTGGKGLHVQFPFEPLYDWETVKSFSKTIVLEMVSRHSDQYTANIVKKARTGKIFLDYLRNGRGATAVAPYSLRAREISSVAMPITWEELESLKDPAMFTLEKALAYLAKRKKDPWKDYFSTKQKIALLS